MKKLLLPALLLAATLAHAENTAAAWKSDDSNITFLSSKINKALNSITEQSGFTSAKSQLSAAGDFNMTIDLASVKTNIELRDQRLRDWVFETGQYANAEITDKVDMSAIEKLGEGETLALQQPLTLNIHGKQIPITADLAVQRNPGDKITVTTRMPVVLDVKQMDMSKGVAQLVEVMGLSSIVEQVPVSFSGTFHR